MFIAALERSIIARRVGAAILGGALLAGPTGCCHKGVLVRGGWCFEVKRPQQPCSSGGCDDSQYCEGEEIEGAGGPAVVDDAAYGISRFHPVPTSPVFGTAQPTQGRGLETMPHRKYPSRLQPHVDTLQPYDAQDEAERKTRERDAERDQNLPLPGMRLP